MERLPFVHKTFGCWNNLNCWMRSQNWRNGVGGGTDKTFFVGADNYRNFSNIMRIFFPENYSKVGVLIPPSIVNYTIGEKTHSQSNLPIINDNHEYTRTYTYYLSNYWILFTQGTCRSCLLDHNFPRRQFLVGTAILCRTGCSLSGWQCIQQFQRAYRILPNLCWLTATS